ncbi:MAG TPA: NUDIX domain-containing protein [Terriglobales bacterium]|jgi:8-oxo-dGTP pyrophosphatase MutT (NUDIX family)|nr:NUDIX domain-containing protein [Terriglobales bacterium]
MTREFSAGGLVVRQMHGRWWLAAIEPAGRTKPGKKPVLALPKGLLDAGERPEQTALREVREETGVEAALITKLGDIKYVYTQSWAAGERVFKVVSFYLLSYKSGQLGEISSEMRVEVCRVEWIPLEDAPRQLAYKGEREMAAKAIDYIRRNPELKQVEE